MKRQKRTTIKDIAQRLGLSHMTVSRALADNSKARVSPATRQKVRETALAMRYRADLLARAVVTRKSGVLGLLIRDPNEPDLLLASQVKGIVMEAHRHGYQIMVEIATSFPSKNPLDDQQVQIWQMISRGVDGLLIHTRGGRDEARRIVDAVGDAVPVVAFSQALEGISCVVLDRAAGTYEATEHLIRLGHRRIGFVRWDRDSAATEAKWKGYLRVVEEHGLTPERAIVDAPTLTAYYQMGIQLGCAYDRPTALICWGDMPAIGICRGLQEAGVRVPEEMAVVGFDGIEIGTYCTPPLTTVAQPVAEICREAVQLLIDQLNGESEVKQVVVQPYLVVRRSCGAGCDGVRREA